MRILIAVGFLLVFLSGMAQSAFEHPRGIVSLDEINEVRQRLDNNPYKTWLEKIRNTTIQTEKSSDKSDPYQNIFLAQKQAQLYLLTENKDWAEKCWNSLQPVINDEAYFNNPISRGLTRATQLFGVAICYDFCFHAWNEAQQKEVVEKLFQTMLTVNSNMGYSANYAIESNWNGVRWGSALLAALVYDDLERKYERNPALPFIWDIQKRLQDHTNRNIFPGGWSAESLSYHVYNWSFIGPALAALQNSNKNLVFELENFAPHAINSLHGWSTSTVSIEHPSGKGIQPDLSDDDPQANYLMAALGLRLYPKEQIPAIKWMHDYLLDVDLIDDERAYLFYSLCWYPDDVEVKNPGQLGWKTFIDSTYGVAVWRNRFQDEKDMVVAFNAPLKRVNGHKGPDNLTFRIIGLGNIWVTGAGRTGQIAGQTNLFASTPETNDRVNSKDFESYSFTYGKNGNVYFASANGSCMGVDNHKRNIEVEFQGKNSAVIKIKDTSENGKIWRLNTPEFNEVIILENGFLLKAPNGTKMKVTAPQQQISGEIMVSKVKYGGNTTNHNSGIGFGGNYWEYNKAIDIPCFGNIEIRMELNKN